MNSKVADIRRDYSQKQLLETNVAATPYEQFTAWWQEVIAAQIDEANAMTLATASADGFPSARIVLLKDFTEKGFSFFTNYESYKGKQLEENPKACLVFFWKELERQVRVTGLVERLGEGESNEYYQSRPEASRIGAWTSPQSQVIENRQWLDDHFNEMVKELEGTEIKKPPYWGGYIVKPVIIEFWQGRPGRLHDRIQYSLQGDGSWKIERLAP
jgi:pyridoxamine 5'-phosphate oxidase